MKRLYLLLLSLVSLSYFNLPLNAADQQSLLKEEGCGGDGAYERSSALVFREEVEDVSAVRKHITREGAGVFLFDADEVLFTYDVRDGGKVVRVRLYDDIELLVENIKGRDHEVYIVTYNRETVIRDALKEIGLSDTLFDGIISCEMSGDVKTAKGEKLRKFMEDSKKRYDFAVFIDNFPPFVENIEEVAREMELRLYSFIATGYLEKYYYRYVYDYLKKLQADLSESKDVGEKLTRINKSLIKYRIDINQFIETFPKLKPFKTHVKGLIWPYLVYL
ncbi:MAG: hypothetical protein H6492_02995 [Candidatus Paracaedibacteraceae bacterium]|nr:hypothetical protein [Candidatus Paracaedibacteraceae bacterium]